jgi:RNA polymerase sigma-70 factor (ECF subfamily)
LPALGQNFEPPVRGPDEPVESPVLNPSDSTSSSLLCRAQAREPEAWQRLMALYSPLVRHWCRQAGVPKYEIPDASQEVFAAVASSLGTFRSDHPGTTFRAWMRAIARRRLWRRARRRCEPAVGGTDLQKRLEQVPAPADEDELELSESPVEVTGLYRRALRQVQHQFEDRTWTAFWRVTVENRSPAEVAAELGITANAVRQAKSRVLRRLREEMGELTA